MADYKSKKITIKTNDNTCYYTISGDLTKYYDLQNIEINHPEMKDYIKENKSMLESLLLRQKELLMISQKK